MFVNSLARPVLPQIKSGISLKREFQKRYQPRPNHADNDNGVFNHSSTGELNAIFNLNPNFLSGDLNNLLTLIGESIYCHNLMSHLGLKRPKMNPIP